MLSVVVYGRNDSHGFNLHKRAAISLNTMAAGLDAPGDEIVFVDYNTPDDLPSFPEMIADTLTPDARRRLRVVRVRPARHRRAAPPGALPVLPALCHNIGIRRTSPANRWVLITTTDMVVVPRQPDETLSGIAASLPDGAYGLPRFEVPEALWLALDRRDPGGVVAALRRWGTGLQLNEVVHDNPVVLYDAPGDFQLVLRADLFAIDGLDERMLRGWQHIDSNLARRLQLRRGEIRSLLGRAFGYHCDHTQQGAATHRPDREENDHDRFVTLVAEPALPGQRDAWGLGGAALEEFSLEDAPTRRVEAALDGLVAPLASPFIEASRAHRNFNRLDYPLGHVLPFLASHLATLPPGSVLACAGAAPALVEALAALRRRLGADGPVLVAAGPDAPTAGAEAVDPATLLRRADAFLFDFGQAAGAGARPQAIHAAPAAVRRRLLALRALFLETVAAERAAVAAGAAPRRVIGINVIHTEFEPLFAAHVAATLTPFGTRVRAGTVATSPAPPPPDPTGFLTRRLRRLEPVAAAEHARARAALATLAGQAADGTARIDPSLVTEPVLALLDWDGLEAAEGIAPDRAGSLKRMLAPHRPAAALRRRLSVPAQPAPGAPVELCALAAAEHWDDPDWARWARAWYPDGWRDDYHVRNRLDWERVHILHGLDRLGVLAGARVAVVAAGKDRLPAVLANHAAAVVLLAARGDGPPPADWLDVPYLCDPDRLAACGWDGAGDGYDAVALPGNAALADGPDGIVPALERAAARLRPGGALAFAVDTVLDHMDHPRWPTVAGAGALAERLVAARLVPCNPLAAALGDSTLDRVAEEGTPSAGLPHFVLRDGIALRGTAVWFCRRVDGAPGQQPVAPGLLS